MGTEPEGFQRSILWTISCELGRMLGDLSRSDAETPDC